MANSQLGVLGQMHSVIRGMGRKAINSDYSCSIEGFEDLWALTKQCPFPYSGSAGEIEVAGPLGSAMWERQQNKTAKQGTITFMETNEHRIDQAMRSMIAQSGEQGGWFNIKVFHGVPNKHIGGKILVDCFFVPDDLDTDWENRSQLLTVTGQLFYHYYGEDIPANSPTL